MSEIGFSIPGIEVERELGAGGMATVYLGLQQALDRRVAIKVLRGDVEDASDVKRFLNEGRTLARLPHPNIVGVYDIVNCEPHPYIVMEFLSGGVLTERMRKGLTLSEAISIIVQIADALQFAHDNGIIHRDLKPGNIMFRGRRTPVLTDFGIARLHGNDVTRLTRTGMMVGTPAYMSPEQAMGKEVDGRSDQYSLGVLFYELLTQEVPFVRDTPMQVAFAHVHEAPRGLPLKFEFAQPLIDKMLSKKPEDRFPDMKSFVRELREVVTNNSGLRHRLQINTAQNLSEQLRALGFTDNQLSASAAPRGPLLASPIPKADLQPGELVQQLIEQSETKLELAPMRDSFTGYVPRHVPHHMPEPRAGRRETQKLPAGTFLRVLIVAGIALVLAKFLLN